MHKLFFFLRVRGKLLIICQDRVQAGTLMANKNIWSPPTTVDLDKTGLIGGGVMAI